MAARNEVLVGRALELVTLQGLLDGTCAGGANAVFLSGEPGIGKTHVLGELVRQAESRGCLVLEGSAAEFEQELPFGVVIDALDAYVESLEDRSVDRLAADGLEELAEVFPSLRSLRGGGGGTATATERSASTTQCGSCSSAWPPSSRWCWCSTTSIGPTPRRSNWSPT